LQLEVPLVEVAELAFRAHQAGARVVLNAAPAVPLPIALIRSVDVLVVNEHEAAAYAATWGLPTQPAAFLARAREQFGISVVLTLGAQGAIALAQAELASSTPPTVRIVDTTGAGDALVGSLVAALDRGAALPEALAQGVAAGAFACTHSGAQYP